MADTWDDDSRGGSKIKESWEDDDGANTRIKDNWEDEDDDENVKESWEEEEETKKPASKTTTSKAGGKAAASKSKGPERELTEEEKKEAQLRADLEHTTELFGLDKSLNEISLRTKEDYQNYIDCFYARVNIHNSSPLYFDFLDDLFKALCKDVPLESLRKLSNNMRTLYDARVVEEKQSKTKDSKAKKGKGKIKQVRGEFDSFLKDGGVFEDKAGTYDDVEDDFI